MVRMLLVLSFLCFVPFAAHASDDSDRADIRQMRTNTLNRLFKEQPEAKDELSRSVGYAVFSSGGVNLVILSAAYGSGVAFDRQTGKETFMKMASGGLGLGLGVKDYRLVFVFRHALENPGH